MSLTISWSHFQSPRVLWLPPPPGGHEDVITIRTPNALGRYGVDHIEFALITDPSITWWKQLRVVNPNNAPNEQQLGVSWTQDNIHAGDVLLYKMSSLRGAKLELWKARTFGAHVCMYELDINSMPPAWAGTRLTFDWFRDSG
jgi:hypothetical protein